MAPCMGTCSNMLHLSSVSLTAWCFQIISTFLYFKIKTRYFFPGTNSSNLLVCKKKSWVFLPSIECGCQSKQRAQSHRHEQRAEHCDHSSQSQAPLRLHHVNLTCKEPKGHTHTHCEHTLWTYTHTDDYSSNYCIYSFNSSVVRTDVPTANPLQKCLKRLIHH